MCPLSYLFLTRLRGLPSPAMLRINSLRNLALGSAVYLANACGAPAAASPATADTASGSTTVLSRDSFGQVHTQDTPAVDTESPAWLAGLQQGDVLSYRIETPNSHTHMVQLRVARMIRQGQSAAALLVPVGEEVHAEVKAHWLAGDAEGLYELAAHESLLDPGFTPIAADGRVVDSGRSQALWRVPQSWDEVVQHEQQTSLSGWSVEELDLTLEGPVRGDRCARIKKEVDGSRVRMTVCANLGMVDLTRGDEQELGETWELVEIARATP